MERSEIKVGEIRLAGAVTKPEMADQDLSRRLEEAGARIIALKQDLLSAYAETDNCG